MTPDTLDDQLAKHLTDAHSIEEQALTQMRDAPGIAGRPALAAAFEAHTPETERHELLVRERLEARGAKPSMLKDLAGKAGGKGMVLFARFNPDTPGKLAAHAFSYEHMELAAYELLVRVAERAGDTDTAEVARTIRDEEQAMADRLAGLFDEAADASLEAVPPDDLTQQLTKYLADAHALEAQAVQLLERGPTIAGESELARVFAAHLEESRGHMREVEERLDALGGSPSKLQDAAMRLGALNLGGFFQAQPDTPAKLAGFAFAFEHLEIAGYELLRRVATRAGDDETARTAERILTQERAAAQAIAGTWDQVVDASLQAQGVA